MKPDRIDYEENCSVLEELKLKKMRFRLGEGLVSSEPIPAGKVISSFPEAEVVNERTYLSVQTSETEDIVVPHILGPLNHSCNPNVFLDVEKKQVLALKDIPVGTVLTFFYPQTEWHMVSPFECHCDSEKCLGIVRGADVLTMEQQASYKLSPHIERLLEKRDGKRVRTQPHLLQGSIP